MICFFQDWSVNKKNPKGRIVLFLYRIASWCSVQPRYLRFILIPYVIVYRILVEWILGVELPWKLRMGKRISIYHGQGLVIHDAACIGDDCTLRHNTTIGVKETNKKFGGKAPTIGRNVDVGANVVIIGEIEVGEHSVIGAGSVVIKDIPPYSVVVGNPARVVGIRERE